MTHHSPQSKTITDQYLIEIVQALENLDDSLQQEVQNGTIPLQFAVQIGRKLNATQQRAYRIFCLDEQVLEKYKSKVLHAFSLNFAEWAIQNVLRIYQLADKVRATLVMLNDVMDEFEEVMLQFEYEFLDGRLPQDEEQLENKLLLIEQQLGNLYHRAPHQHKKAYNKTYGDSSTSAFIKVDGVDGVSFNALIGVSDDASPEQVKQQSRHLLKVLHPDQGGSSYLFHIVKKAQDIYKSR